MNWVKSTLTDSEGRYDVAYVSLFWVMAAVCNAIVVMCAVAAIAYFRCRVFEVNGVTVNCAYDPQPLGIAIGAACGGFATALAALAGYMVATRPPRPAAPPQPAGTTINMQPAAPAAPLEVDVVGLPGDPPKAKAKAKQPRRSRKGTR